MIIAEINQVDYGSTGTIMLQIAEKIEEGGNKSYTFSKKWRKQIAKSPNHKYFGYTIENAFHVIFARLFGYQELYSYAGTKQLVKFLDNINPDILHLHNLHDYCFCLPVLFKYIKEKKVPVVWTLHDCWAFTGQCPCFTMAKCDKWTDGCHDCPQIDNLLKIDCSKYMWMKKKELFTNVENMTVVTPSKWLADLASKSFLKDYRIQVINNGIDLDVFSPTRSDFRNKYRINDKHIVLGVSMGWNKRKGLDIMIDISNRLSDKYQVVMVGTNEALDNILPKNIISIHRTESQKELAEIYSSADVFINPTREDNFPTVNIEALACGAPVVTFNTGGCPEIINKNCGVVVDCEDVDALEQAIKDICKNKRFSKEDCTKRASIFDKNKKYQEYIELFNNIMRQGV